MITGIILVIIILVALKFIVLDKTHHRKEVEIIRKVKEHKGYKGV